MQTRFSTSDVHPRDRLSYWQDVACKAFVEIECRTCSRTKFTAEISSTALADIGVSIVETDGCEVLRRRGGILRASGDEVLLSLQLAGASTLQQGDRQAQLTAGDFAIYDTLQPYALRVTPGVRQLVLKLPRFELENRLGFVVRHVARPVRADLGLGAFASGFLAHVAARADAIAGLDARAAHDLRSVVFDVIASALRDSIAPDDNQSYSRDLTLSRLKLGIERQLADPGLKPHTAAGLAGISVRYANALLASEGWSLERYILRRRLERCAAALGDARQNRRSIGEIALSCGFSDHSHFGKRFRERFGCSPRDYRNDRSNKP